MAKLSVSLIPAAVSASVNAATPPTKETDIMTKQRVQQAAALFGVVLPALYAACYGAKRPLAA